jgi:hypothetical protein
MRVAICTMPSITTGKSAYDSGVSHSLHFGLNAPPAASQASVPGVARETKGML